MRYFLSNAELNLIIKTFCPAIKNLKRGEFLFKKEMNENKVCFLLKGTVYLEVQNEFGAKQILNYFTGGQVISHSMLIQPNNGLCYAIAKYPCSVFWLDAADLENDRQADDGLKLLPAFVFHFTLSTIQQHCHILQQKTIRSKLLTFLYCQSVRQNTLSPKIPIPYSDLADYLCIDRSAMMKELSKLCDEGFIEKKARQITLLITTPCF